MPVAQVTVFMAWYLSIDIVPKVISLALEGDCHFHVMASSQGLQEVERPAKLTGRLGTRSAACTVPPTPAHTSTCLAHLPGPRARSTLGLAPGTTAAPPREHLLLAVTGPSMSCSAH